jgi:hypothetical protein
MVAVGTASLQHSAYLSLWLPALARPTTLPSGTANASASQPASTEHRRHLGHPVQRRHGRSWRVKRLRNAVIADARKAKLTALLEDADRTSPLRRRHNWRSTCRVSIQRELYAMASDDSFTEDEQSPPLASKCSAASRPPWPAPPLIAKRHRQLHRPLQVPPPPISTASAPRKKPTSDWRQRPRRRHRGPQAAPDRPQATCPMPATSDPVALYLALVKSRRRVQVPTEHWRIVATSARTRRSTSSTPRPSGQRQGAHLQQARPRSAPISMCRASTAATLSSIALNTGKASFQRRGGQRAAEAAIQLQERRRAAGRLPERCQIQRPHRLQPEHHLALLIA